MLREKYCHFYFSDRWYAWIIQDKLVPRLATEKTSEDPWGNDVGLFRTKKASDLTVMWKMTKPNSECSLITGFQDRLMWMRMLRLTWNLSVWKLYPSLFQTLLPESLVVGFFFSFLASGKEICKWVYYRSVGISLFQISIYLQSNCSLLDAKRSEKTYLEAATLVRF